MQAEAFHKIHPKEYHKKFLEKKVRPDGRALTACRKTVVVPGSLGTADGSALVKMGSTTVLCGLKLEVGVPLATKPKAGRLEVSVGLGPLCSPKFSVGRATESAIAMGEQLTNVVLSTNVFDVNELCINPGSAVWVVYADIVCMNFDGNVLDACFVALAAALKNLRLPETNTDEAGVVTITEKKVGKLSITHIPIATTFGLLDEYLLADPTSEEEDLLSATVTVVYNHKAELCSVYKPGGAALPQQRLLTECLPLAKARAVEVAKLI